MGTPKKPVKKISKTTGAKRIDDEDEDELTDQPKKKVVDEDEDEDFDMPLDDLRSYESFDDYDDEDDY